MGLPGIVVLICAFSFAYKGYEPLWQLILWGVTVLSVAVGQWWFSKRFFKEQSKYDANIWVKKLSIFSFVLSFLLGASAWLFFTPEDPFQTFLVSVLVVGSIFGSVTFAAAYFPIHVVWLVPLALPFALVLLQGNDEQVVLGALFILVGIPFALRFGWLMSNEYIMSLRLRFEKDELLHDLQVQKEAADKANKDKTHFLAAASHDLRQPHQALGLFLESLAFMETEPKKQDIISKSKQAFNAMSGLLDQLLDISKLDSQTTQADIQAVKLQPLLHRATMELMGQADKKGIELRLRPTAAVVDIDVAMFNRILSNLMTNAIRYTQEGGVLLTVRQRGKFAVLEVWDTGCGIPETKLDYIFDEFTQLENPERDREKGLGLGLAIVRRLTQLMGLTITVQSRLGKGTRFSVFIPLASKPPASIEDIQTAANLSDLKGLNVLIIDDDKVVLDSLSTLLGIWGCEVESFLSKEACEERVKQGEAYCPDVLIVDYRLGNQANGIMTVAAIREACNHDIPALIVTGDTAPERIQEVKQSGLPLLHKPIEPEQLKSFLAKVKREVL